MFGDLNSDGLVDGRDLIIQKNLISGTFTYDDYQLAYIAGSIGTNTNPNGIGLLSMRNYISSEVDFNSDYQVTPEEAKA